MPGHIFCSELSVNCLDLDTKFSVIFDFILVIFMIANFLVFVHALDSSKAIVKTKIVFSTLNLKPNSCPSFILD